MCLWCYRPNLQRKTKKKWKLDVNPSGMKQKRVAYVIIYRYYRWRKAHSCWWLHAVLHSMGSTWGAKKTHTHKDKWYDGLDSLAFARSASTYVSGCFFSSSAIYFGRTRTVAPDFAHGNLMSLSQHSHIVCVTEVVVDGGDSLIALTTISHEGTKHQFARVASMEFGISPTSLLLLLHFFFYKLLMRRQQLVIFSEMLKLRISSSNNDVI